MLHEIKCFTLLMVMKLTQKSLIGLHRDRDCNVKQIRIQGVTDWWTTRGLQSLWAVGLVGTTVWWYNACIPFTPTHACRIKLRINISYFY